MTIVINMRNVFFNLIIIVVMCSCDSNSKPHGKVDSLLKLDSMVWSHPSLQRFTSFQLYTKDLNWEAVCDSVNSQCRPEEKHYATVLEQMGIPIKTFDSIVVKIDQIGFIKYYRYGDYSVWVENGAFGDIYGYLINHNQSVSDVQSFNLDKRYHVGIGPEVRKNVYYFSSGYK